LIDWIQDARILQLAEEWSTVDGGRYNNISSDAVFGQIPPKELWQRIQALGAQIIEYNKSKYDKILTNRQRGKNILQKSKHTLLMQDWINQEVVAAFLQELVWPRTKTLPKNWTKWREDKNGLCQMILKKVSAPVGIEGRIRMYWDLMLLSMTHGKFCSLRSNFKQEIFKQSQGETWFQCKILQKHTANVCTHVFELNVLDDKKNSWCAPGDCTGKVFVKIRELNKKTQDTSTLICWYGALPQVRQQVCEPSGGK
jgi:hypothetical protein